MVGYADDFKLFLTMRIEKVIPQASFSDLLLYAIVIWGGVVDPHSRLLLISGIITSHNTTEYSLYFPFSKKLLCYYQY